MTAPRSSAVLRHPCTAILNAKARRRLARRIYAAPLPPDHPRNVTARFLRRRGDRLGLLLRMVDRNAELAGCTPDEEAAGIRFQLGQGSNRLTVVGLQADGLGQSSTLEDMRHRLDDTASAWADTEYRAATAERCARDLLNMSAAALGLLDDLEDTETTNRETWPAESPPTKRRHRSPMCTAHPSTAPPRIMSWLDATGMARHVRRRETPT